MEPTKIDKAIENSRSEEVHHIIERMPLRFGFGISMIVVVLFTIMVIFGWIIRYPDIVKGQIIVHADNAPLKLLANSHGKLKLTAIKSLSDVKEGQLIAYLENPAQPYNVFFIDSLIRPYNPNSDDMLNLYHKLPKNFSLGELNVKYYEFSSALEQFINFEQDDLYDKQTISLIEIIDEQKKAIFSAEQRIIMAIKTLNYIHKFYSRDSILFSKKVISESELDKTQMNYISAKDAYQSSINSLTNFKQQFQQSESKLQELAVNKSEKKKELRMTLISSYNDLVDNIKSWEQKYIFRAPFDGKIQFLKPYQENQTVQTGEEIFTIVSKQNLLHGQVIVPSHGVGKIAKGQQVIVKLDNFPYNEYGSVTGTVNSISLTTSSTKTENSEIETYQVAVNFPDQLKTNYGTHLAFKAEAKGTAEIVTDDRRLVQRLFDNLKYVMNK
ncbi:HlyD family secretion protein [Arcticibacter tournemirensis]|uniref:HlyD family efflux transporter periplasmic adaptor subunit n=1 Tax=Arcticibacter tournemirensis TaxID=699437 RepID=A0A5M9GNE4_9SPHI|nr:HlyD family efflux transporter periplasmic adaptor subunit [Arcticibacter tournemirensis]KAA8474324.1 HlyD family efflux transporter periplasmic adaptor subunit [Arcticibacter tournemirensis]TQM51729.1 HlyD family secretion protein [Arcticibacter tournemirensis]